MPDEGLVSNGLVLSLFPGIDILGRGFEEEGYCVVRGPYPLWGWLDHQPWTMRAKRQMVGNAVPLPMARAVAQAVKKATRERESA